MGLVEIAGLGEMPVWMRLAFYLIDNVLIGVMVGVAVYLVQLRIEVWRERTARRVASDQFVADKVQPLVDVMCASSDDESACRAREAEVVRRLIDASEFHEAAFEPYRAEIDAVEQAMRDLEAVEQKARETGTAPDPALYRELKSALREASKALSNKSSVAVHSV